MLSLHLLRQMVARISPEALGLPQAPKPKSCPCQEPQVTKHVSPGQGDERTLLAGNSESCPQADGEGSSASPGAAAHLWVLPHPSPGTSAGSEGPQGVKRDIIPSLSLLLAVCSSCP